MRVRVRALIWMDTFQQKNIYCWLFRSKVIVNALNKSSQRFCYLGRSPKSFYQGEILNTADYWLFLFCTLSPSTLSCFIFLCLYDKSEKAATSNLFSFFLNSPTKIFLQFVAVPMWWRSKNIGGNGELLH